MGLGRDGSWMGVGWEFSSRSSEIQRSDENLEWRKRRVTYRIRQCCHLELGLAYNCLGVVW